MTAVLDNEPVAIFVTALDDKQLLYAKQSGKGIFKAARRTDCFLLSDRRL